MGAIAPRPIEIGVALDAQHILLPARPRARRGRGLRCDCDGSLPELAAAMRPATDLVPLTAVGRLVIVGRRPLIGRREQAFTPSHLELLPERPRFARCTRKPGQRSDAAFKFVPVCVHDDLGLLRPVLDRALAC